MTDDAPDELDLIPIAAALTEYRISRSTIDRATRAKKLTPYTRLGVNGRLFDRAELDALTTPTPK